MPAGGGAPAGELVADNSNKKRSRGESREQQAHEDGPSAAKRPREPSPEQDNASSCRQRPTGPPDRASAEPAPRETPEHEPMAAAQQEGESGAQGAFGDADLGLVDVELSAALAADSGAGDAFLSLPGGVLDAALEELPMAIDQPSPSSAGVGGEGAIAPASPTAAAVAAVAAEAAEVAAGVGASLEEELSLGAPAEAQATDLPPPPLPASAAPGAAAGTATAAPPAPSKQESALQPQCAVLMGAALEAAEVSTSHCEPHAATGAAGAAAGAAAAAALAPQPSRERALQYQAAKAELQCAIIPPGQAGVSWDHFPHYLGEGIRARLASLATLHLGSAASAVPPAIKELAANSNRVLLGAANNCELFQERVIRALADKMQVPLLVADVYTLKLDDVIKEDAAAPGGSGGGVLDEGGYGGPGFPPEPWDVSDDDDPFSLGLGPPKLDRLGTEKKEGGRDSGKDSGLEAALAARSKLTSRRGIPGMPGYFPLTLGGRQQPLDAVGSAAVAAAKAAAERAGEAAERAKAAVKAASDRVTAARGAAAAAAAVAATAAAAAHPAPGAGAEGDAAGAATPVPEPQDGAGKAPTPAPAAAAQQPSASVAASVPAVPDAAAAAAAAPAADGPATGAAAPALPAASVAPATVPPPAAAPPAAQQAQQGAQQSAAASKSAATLLRGGERVSYLGRVHPSLAAAQERLEQLQAAISRVETSSSHRAREYLPQLLVRRTLVAAQSQRVPRMQGSCAPPIGSKGRVLGVTGEKVQVAFDEPFSGGASAPGQKDKSVFYCGADDLQVIEDKEDHLVSSLQALFDVIGEAAEAGPLIVFVQNLDRLLRTHAADHFRKLETLLAALPPRCLLFAGYCSRTLARSEAKRDGGPPGLSRFFGSLGGSDSGLGAAMGGPDDISLLDRFGRGPGGRGGQRKSTKGKLLSKMLPNHLELHPPNSEAHAKAWKKMIESDVATMRQRSNRTALRKALARCGCNCDDWDAVSITDCQLGRKEIEQIVGDAVALQLSAQGGAGEAAQATDAAVVAGVDALAAQGVAAEAAEAAAGAEKAGDAAAQTEAAAGVLPAAVQQQPLQQDGPQQQQQQCAQDVQQPPSVAEAAAGAVLGDGEGACAMQTDEDASPAAAAATTAAAGGSPAHADQQPQGQLAPQQKAAPLWTLRAEYIMAAADSIRKLGQEAAAQPDKQALKDVAVDQYEKQLLNEVIPPEEIAVSFDDIGALDAVKNTLHEVVILPLQRPELFMRGSLTKPTKGLLLFGPPGTGKTMLAKAVASESGAHFINVNMSAITSKWFGEGERLVRALFGLAHKLSPSVIFVDEIDSFLSKRGQSSNEHEALRKMKNEFMQHWDGLRTKQSDRVLVLAATNRPMDLDDAVIRRMPRRIFVPLPDAANRERILQVILKDEDLCPQFDFKEAAALSDGYSGSDLKNLCIAAAYCPIREFLDGERAAAAAQRAAQQQQQPGEGSGRGGSAASAAAAGAAAAAAAAGGSSAVPAALAAMGGAAPPAPVRLRSISMADFKEALKSVTASTHTDSATMSELRRWNDQYGEGGSRQKEHFAYYT